MRCSAFIVGVFVTLITMAPVQAQAFPVFGVVVETSEPNVVVETSQPMSCATPPPGAAPQTNCAQQPHSSPLVSRFEQWFWWLWSVFGA